MVQALRTKDAASVEASLAQSVRVTSDDGIGGTLQVRTIDKQRLASWLARTASATRFVPYLQSCSPETCEFYAFEMDHATMLFRIAFDERGDVNALWLSTGADSLP